MRNNDAYLGNPNVKRDGVPINFSKEELEEYIKCKASCDYFVRNYVKIIHIDHGLVKFNPYDYQTNLFTKFEDHRFNILLSCRQSGKSITVCAYLLWYAMFHSDKLVAILANKGSTSKEMLSRITLMLENIPFFLQPGCKSLNKGSIEFSNNSKLEAHSTSSSSIRGKSVSLLYLDEFSFVENDVEFYTSTYPVIASGKTSRVIITSTANGIGNMFYRIWEGAVQSTNEYVATRVDWWDVPGRDEAWKQLTISNTSQEQFAQEFGNEFGGGGNTLINASTLLALRAIPPKIVRGDAKIYEEPIEDHKYVMTVDTAKGRGQDYSVFSVIDISVVPFKQVATYRNNLVSPITFPDIIYKIALAYNDAYLIVESNDQGSMVYKTLFYEYEYENMYSGKLAQGVSFGLDMSKKVKRLGCSNMKDIIEQGKLEIYDEDTIKELCVFEAKGSSYAAVSGEHDDLVMSLVIFAWFLNTSLFGYMSDDSLRELMAQDREELIAQSVPFEGSLGGNSDENDLILEIIDERTNQRKEAYALDPDFGIYIVDNNDRHDDFGYF